MCDAGGGAGAPSSPPACYLICHNVSKKHNIGTLARCATAFGVAEVLLVGERSFNTFGAHGADAHVAFRHFPTLAQVREYVVRERGGRVLGVEIAPEARSVASLPFCGPTAFILGNEGQGLSSTQAAICDGFVYIAQHGHGTASLNVACAAAIVLHRFSEWAGYAEAPRDAEQPGKFAVAERPQRTAPRGVAGQDPEEVRAARAARQAAASAQGMDEEDGCAAGLGPL